MCKRFIKICCLVCAVMFTLGSFYRPIVIAEEITDEVIIQPTQDAVVLSYGDEPNYSTSTLYTPVGSAVEARVHLGDVTPTQNYEAIIWYRQYYPYATVLDESTWNYNSHSYAWHNDVPEGNCYWIVDPSVYITDGSAFETTATVGAKVCYYDGFGNIIHSGIVRSVSGGVITVDSKWNKGPLYRHELSHCPYWEDTEYVKYYKFHDFVFTVKGEGTHYINCNDCDFNRVVPHIWGENPNPGQGYICARCLYTASSIPEIQSENTVLLIK